MLKCNSNSLLQKEISDMSKKIRTEAVDYLFSAILSLEDKEECYTFFEDICTINELLSLSQRLQRRQELPPRRSAVLTVL